MRRGEAANHWQMIKRQLSPVCGSTLASPEHTVVDRGREDNGSNHRALFT